MGVWKYPTGKRLAMMECMASGSKIHIHSRQTSTRNEQMLTRIISTWLDDKKKDHIDPKRTQAKDCSKQLQTDNLPTDDVENINSTNKRRDVLLTNKSWIVPWRTEWRPQMIQRHSRITLHRATHPKREQHWTEKSSYCLDWLQKSICQVLASIFYDCVEYLDKPPTSSLDKFWM